LFKNVHFWCKKGIGRKVLSPLYCTRSKRQLLQLENLATLQEAVTRALIDAEKDIILGSQCLGLIPWPVVALGTITLEVRVLERELYVRFMYLPVYRSTAGKGKRGRDEYIKES